MNRLSTIALIILCCCLYSCTTIRSAVDFDDPHTPRFADFTIAAPLRSPAKTIKVVSYNIELCERIEGAIRFLRENKDLKDADIICLQEMCPSGVEYLARSLGYNYVYYPCTVHPVTGDDFGQAVLSKWPIKQDEKVLLPFSSEDKYAKMRKSAVGVTVYINGKTITVFSAHCGVLITPQQRTGQIRTILNAVPTNECCIIAGDFNTYSAAHTNAVATAMASSGFEDATRSVSWTYNYWYLLNRKVALDHIFSRGLTIISAGSVADRTNSDHLPIWAEFKLENGE